MSDQLSDQSAATRRPIPSAKRTAAHIVLVLLLVAGMVGICAHGPSQTYAYSQIRWVGIAMGALRDGNWLLPRNHLGEVAHKPQLYFWLEAAALKLTGIYHDFVFRLPTVVAGLVTAVMVYFLGRRWYGRRAGLLAACLWATLAQMSKMIYIGTTDMLLTMWITASILCIDRLLFHRVPPERRLRWVIGLWATMILGAMTKGWGVVNPVLVGGMAALAVAVRPGFKAIRRQQGTGRKALLVLRLVGRRWWRAARTVRLGWGLLALAAVLVPIWLGMLFHPERGQQFRQWVHYGIWQRMTGLGEDPPKGTRVPPALQLIYHTLPASVFAVGGLLLVRVRKWFARGSPVCLPLCWILGVVVPFSLTHGFRPDYLLPCYAAVALLGAWAVETAHRRGRTGLRPGGAGPRTVRALRHVFAAAAVLVGLALIAGSAGALWYASFPKFLTKAVPVPDYLEPESWWVVSVLLPAGVAVAAAAVWASLRWQLRRVAAAAVVGMVGVAFLRTHVINRHACTRDGEKMIDFARRVGKVVGDDEVAVYRMEDLATEIYLGRFGLPVGFAVHQIGSPRAARPSSPKSPAPVDPYFVRVELGFERITGLRADDIFGKDEETGKAIRELAPDDAAPGKIRDKSKTIRQVFPEIAPRWIDAVGRAASEAEPVRFAYYSRPLDRDYEVIVFRCPDARRFASLFLPCFDKAQRRWLATCERGMIELGARKIVPDGAKEVEVVVPRKLGWPRVVGESVFSRGWGRLYLIELQRPIRVSSEPRLTEYVSGKRGRFW